MGIEAKVIEDSISPEGIRLTTLQLTYPRYVHSELMTHRVFSRNASSSRAIPVAKLATAALENMVEPIRYGKNQAGMQASMEDLQGADLEKARAVWARMANECAKGAQELAELGLHKQWANRPLEWFSNISVVVTATEFENFFALRNHVAAQPEIRELAIQMQAAMEASKPILLTPGQWHLPYVTDAERTSFEDSLVWRKISAARCARVSYLLHDGQTPNCDKDLALYYRLMGMVPAHASPVEHQATPDQPYGDGSEDRWYRPELHGNFKGWRQFRKMIELQSDYKVTTD